MDIVAPGPGVKLLDMAAGTGDATVLFFDYQDNVNQDTKSTVTMVDLNANMLELAKKRLGNTRWSADGRIEYMQGNAEHMPEIPDNTFDIYCCISGFHNMPNHLKAMKEAMRVLKPGGKICIGDINNGVGPVGTMLRRAFNRHVFFPLVLWTQEDRDMAHRIKESSLTFPSPPDFVEELKKAGFEIEGCGYHFLGFMSMAVLFTGTKPMGAE
ncbi:S-adenosyl-L-methionine-dependent methyltransferase [Linderina pennispora]|uniref:S-adenosyl-L-methionine-dependent methyltransferase n=1 Tax=Linderina pennispora TaxID=61395 RepID=A0A1Y1WAP4_9FUNG|nr:S-adenosyl-L-methionine-dependent methyltransferase [Linderina pennispora]ORX70601.1 S-adenosyl-L-methionine-dependent methyltransferase [Linderina pennispora]